MYRVWSILIVSSLIGCRPSDRHVQIALEVTDGAHEGRYRITASAGTCTPDVLGRGSLAIRHTDLDSAAALSSLQLVIPSDSGFYLGVVFGGFQSDGAGHEIETRPGYAQVGDGVVNVTRSDTIILLEASGHTGDGVRLKARVSCAARDTAMHVDALHGTSVLARRAMVGGRESGA